jgi:ribosomal protein S18 acetylase RimI-like enzyme
VVDRPDPVTAGAVMIRPITPTDVPALADLSAGTGFFHPGEIETLHGVLADYFASSRDDFGHRAVLIEVNGRPVGYVYFAPEEMTDRTWYVWWIAVAADQQGQGIGGQLLAFAESEIRAVGGRFIAIETSSTPKYEPTRGFYLKHGYTHAATVPDLYADGDGMAIFTKRL